MIMRTCVGLDVPRLPVRRGPRNWELSCAHMLHVGIASSDRLAAVASHETPYLKVVQGDLVE